MCIRVSWWLSLFRLSTNCSWTPSEIGFPNGIESSGNTFHNLLRRLFRSVKIDCQMVESDRTLIKPVLDRDGVRHQAKDEAAPRFHDVPAPELRPVSFVDDLEAHDVVPPAGTSLDICDR